MNPQYYNSIFSKVARQDEAPCTIQKLSQKSAVLDPEDRPCTPNYFELIWITKGTGNQWIDLEKISITNDRIMCIHPGQVYRLESNDEIDGYVIKLKTDFIASLSREVNSLPLIALLELFSGPKGILLTSQMKMVFNELINQMQHVLDSTDLLKTELLNCYIEILITHLSQQWDGSAEVCLRTRNTELVESFLSLLENKFRTERSVSKYASYLAVTPNYLNEVIKKITGYSAGNIIRRRVGLEAKRKAMHSKMCMKEVAYDLGFSDPAHFSKFFKNATGYNFSHFRKEKITISLSSMRYVTD